MRSGAIVALAALPMVIGAAAFMVAESCAVERVEAECTDACLPGERSISRRVPFGLDSCLCLGPDGTRYDPYSPTESDQ